MYIYFMYMLQVNHCARLDVAENILIYQNKKRRQRERKREKERKKIVFRYS